MHTARLTQLVHAAATISILSALPGGAAAQAFPTNDPVIRRMWEVGIENSQTEQLAHHLINVIGPRLAGTPNLAAAQDWLVDLYGSWGVSARKEEYGTWRGWQQGVLHVDMLEPRVRTLEARLLAWSPSTDGPIEGEVALPPEGLTEETAQEWLRSVRGKFVLMSAPEPMCRAPQELQRYARPETVERLDEARTASFRGWAARIAPLGNPRQLEATIDEAGALGGQQTAAVPGAQPLLAQSLGVGVEAAHQLRVAQRVRAAGSLVHPQRGSVGRFAGPVADAVDHGHPASPL